MDPNKHQNVMHGCNEYIVEVERTQDVRGEWLNLWSGYVCIFPTRQPMVPKFDIMGAASTDAAFDQAVERLHKARA